MLTRMSTGQTTEYDTLWTKISLCESCKFDRRIDPKIRERWQAIETPFLPFPGVGPEPPGLPVRYLLVGMEPSERPKRKKTREYMRRKIAEGSRNFKGDAHIRFAAHNWLSSYWLQPKRMKSTTLESAGTRSVTGSSSLRGCPDQCLGDSRASGGAEFRASAVHTRNAIR